MGELVFSSTVKALKKTARTTGCESLWTSASIAEIASAWSSFFSDTISLSARRVALRWMRRGEKLPAMGRIEEKVKRLEKKGFIGALQSRAGNSV
jgi:hypothetical protein